VVAKEDALRRLLATEGTLSETLARVLHQMKTVRVYSDIT
jgi:hypothetical protein